MKSIVMVCCLLCLAGAAYADNTRTASSQAEPAAAKYSKSLALELLKASDANMYPKYFKSTFTMTTHRKNKKDLKYAYLMHGKGNNTALMEITAPAREKGKKILMTKDNLWMYIPAVSRPIRLSRKQSFMGSAFSNEDLMESNMADDYDPEIIDQKGKQYLLKLKAKRRSVAYARIDMWVDGQTKIPSLATYYGLSGAVIKKMEFSDVAKLGGKLRPATMVMYDLLEEGAYTQVHMETLVALTSVPDYMFDQSQLGR